MAKERYAGPPHLTEAQLIAQRKKIRGDGVITQIGSMAQGFMEDALTTFSDSRKMARYQSVSYTHLTLPTILLV